MPLCHPPTIFTFHPNIRDDKLRAPVLATNGGLLGKEHDNYGGLTVGVNMNIIKRE